MKNVALRLPDDVAEAIDRARGVMARNTWIVEACRVHSLPSAPGEINMLDEGVSKIALQVDEDRADFFRKATQ